MNTRRIKRAGLKVTNQRVTLLEFLRKPENQHLCAEQVYLGLRQQGEDLGINTVYRVLNHFLQVGIIVRHYFETDKAVYELNREKQHDHLVCLACGKVMEFHDEIIEQRQKMVAHHLGMDFERHNLILYGYCADGCQANPQQVSQDIQAAKSGQICKL